MGNLVLEQLTYLHGLIHYSYQEVPLLHRLIRTHGHLRAPTQARCQKLSMSKLGLNHLGYQDLIGILIVNLYKYTFILATFYAQYQVIVLDGPAIINILLQLSKNYLRHVAPKCRLAASVGG